MLSEDTILEDFELPPGVLRLAALVREPEESFQRALGLVVMECLGRRGLLKNLNQEAIAEIRETIRDFLERDWACQLDLLICILKLRFSLLLASALSESDSLTGLSNRGAGARRARKLLEVDPGKEVVVIMLDLDHFKNVNDAYGHLAGDAVLKARAGQISLSLRPGDIVVRYGGEEFLIILETNDIEVGAAIARRLRVQFAQEPVHFNGESIPVTSSFGVAKGPLQDVLNGSDVGGPLVQAADAQLYKAKGRRNRVCVESRDPIS